MFLKYLEKRGLSVSQSEKSVTFSQTQSEGDVSTQYWPEYRINGYLTMTYDGCDSSYVWTDFKWQFEEGGFPEPPLDTASLHWASNHFSRVPDSEYGGPDVCLDNYCADKSATGFAVRFDTYDRYWGSNEKDDGDDIAVESNFGLKAQVVDNSLDPQARFMTADYKHWFKDVEVSGISIGAGGLTYSIADSNKEHTWQDDISYANAEVGSGCGIT